MRASRVAVSYTDDQASFPDSVSTCLSFSGGPTLLHAEQLRGARRCKVRLRLSRLRESMHAPPGDPARLEAGCSPTEKLG